MRWLICMLTITAMLTSACGALPFRNFSFGKQKAHFAVVDWKKLMKDHPKYKQLIASGDAVESAMRMRDRQLQAGRQQIDLLARMKGLKTQGKDHFMRAEFSAKMAEQEAIENDKLRKLAAAASVEAEQEVAKDRAAIEEAYRLPILNLRMKLESVKMTKSAREAVLQELKEVIQTKNQDLSRVEAKKADIVNKKMSGAMQSARERMTAFAKDKQSSIMSKGLGIEGPNGKTFDSKEGAAELDQVIASMDKQIKIKQELHDKLLDDINGDINSAIKKINLSKKYTLVFKNVRANISADDITDAVNAEVKNIAN